MEAREKQARIPKKAGLTVCYKKLVPFRVCKEKKAATNTKSAVAHEKTPSRSRIQNKNNHAL